MIDNRDPRRPRTANSKGARLEAERNAQIMHENTILLNKLSRILTRDAEPPRAQLVARGLNDPQRRIEREKIDRDNLMLLRRLQYVKPSIDTEAQLQQHREHAHLLAMSRNFAANPFLLNGGPLPAGSGVAAARRSRPQSGPAKMSSSDLGGASCFADPSSTQDEIDKLAEEMAAMERPGSAGAAFPPVQEAEEDETNAHG